MLLFFTTSLAEFRDIDLEDERLRRSGQLLKLISCTLA